MAINRRKVEIRKIPTGVPHLDPVLGGGIPAYSTNTLVGPPGAGKTTLVHEFLSRNATPEAKAIYFVALGEPTLKMLRYQQQFDFFDQSKIDSAIIYIDIGTIAREHGINQVLEVITQQVEKIGPAFVVIDSFKGLKEVAVARGENVRTFVHDISNILGAWSVTSFLLGEYTFDETQSLSEFSAADGIILLVQQRSGNAVVRKIEAVKMRGQGALPGRHTFRITSGGVEVFPRMMPIGEWPRLPLDRDRVKFGVQGLDQMMNGGIPRGEVTLVAGSAGTGKTLLSLYFIAEGVQHGEPGVMVTFEENPQEHERKARSFGWNLAEWEKQNMLGMIYLRPMDLSVDEVLARVLEKVERLKAKRVIINSISGFEMGISSSDQPEFRESLFRLVASLSGQGITTVMTTEIPNVLGDFIISEQHISFISDNAIVLRFTEIESQLRKVVMVIKMRTSAHDTDLRQYEITNKGITVQKALTEYSGVLSGIPTLRTIIEPQPFTAGLSEQEESLMHVLLALGEASPDQLAESMGIDVKLTTGILDKLVDTGYIARTGTKTHPKYRVALVTPGLMLRRR